MGLSPERRHLKDRASEHDSKAEKIRARVRELEKRHAKYISKEGFFKANMMLDKEVIDDVLRVAREVDEHEETKFALRDKAFGPDWRNDPDPDVQEEIKTMQERRDLIARLESRKASLED